MRLIDADSIMSKINHDLIICKKESFEDYKVVLTLMGQAIENEPTVDPKTLYEEKRNEMLGREYVAYDFRNGEGVIVGRFIGEPIVRCKDCEQYNGKIECGNGLLTEPDDFCSFGVRKEVKHETD